MWYYIWKSKGCFLISLTGLSLFITIRWRLWYDLEYKMDFLRSVQKYHWSTDRNFHLPKKNCMRQFRKSNLLQMLTHVLIIPFICAVFEIWQTHMLILKQNHFFVLYMWISISFSLLLWHFHLNIYYWTFRHITSILTELNNFEANLNIWFSQ